jgi:formamidopyrimidine-DNA glycosylase
MPELPEVEVTRLSFADRIQGATIQEVITGLPLRWPLGCHPSTLTGQTIHSVKRRGKYLLMELDPAILMIHLGMSGSLRFEQAILMPRKTHDHFVLNTTRGSLTLNDPRRFGAVVYAKDRQDPVLEKLLGHLGVEPLGEEFTPEHLYRSLKKRQVSIKQALLGGQIVVGVGNIYASESLFMSRIRPTRKSSSITKHQAQRLYESIRATLSRAIEVGGSTLQNFSSASGQSGYFQLESFVYARLGQPCRLCATPIKQIVQGQRSTFFCPSCQK